MIKKEVDANGCRLHDRMTILNDSIPLSFSLNFVGLLT